MVFFSLEDETGLIHVTVMPDVYQRVGAAVNGAGLVVVTGRAEWRGEGVSLLAEEVRRCEFAAGTCGRGTDTDRETHR